MRISDWSSDVCSSDLGATPIDQMVCRIQFAKYRYEGQFTPPTAGYGNLGYPAFDGIIDWHGATIDPTRRPLIANASYIPFTYRRSEERRVWKECVSTCRSRWSPYN